KDNALVLSMFIASDVLSRVKRLRKRPFKILLAAKTSRVPFGIYTKAWLEILKYEDLYNYEIRAVDRGN
ncbi:hypothetical protein DL98DRAFT_443008, partial [Cadophora sp. DSE1049]